MKKLHMLMALTLVAGLSVNAFAAKMILTCTGNAGVSAVYLMEVSPDVYRADVKVESVGDSHHTFSFHNIELLPFSGRIGAPSRYRGEGFDLKVYAEGRIRAILNVASLNIRNEQLGCR
jgi:hypothetical protein